MTTAALSKKDPLVPLETFPPWIFFVRSGRVQYVETLRSEEYATAQKVLETWARIYGDFPKNIGPGDYIPDRMSKRLHSGKILVARDAKRMPQAFVRVSDFASSLFPSSPDHLYVEELVVAPWHHTQCSQFIAENSDFTFLLAKQDILKLTELYETTIAGLFTSQRGIGTLMMYAVCKLVRMVGKENLLLQTLTKAQGFYAKLGMQPQMAVTVHNGKNTFYILFGLNMPSTLPPTLVDRVKRYFPRMAGLEFS